MEAELPLSDGDGVDGERPRVTCRLCGRPLTGRTRRRGIGDGCRAKLHERTAPRPPAHEVDQDPLPGL
jgi:hypothetical protein